jgi:hypothetical protein
VSAARGAPLRVAAALLVLLGGVALAATPRAEAARGLTTGLYAPEYFSSDSSIRDRWFDATAEANVGIVRFLVRWRDVAGSSAPADPTDPSSTGYDFSDVDRAVREARQRGFEVLFTIYDAPHWAEGPGRPSGARPGSWKPDAAAFGDFATALAQRYSGAFPDPAGPGVLPRVRYYEVWNEPNLIGFLAPQWEGGEPESPSIYRRLLNALAGAVKGVHGDNLVVGPGTSPFGQPRGQRQMRPLYFLRELLCLDGRGKPKPKPCPERPQLDVVSHHPIAVNQGPRYTAEHPDDVSAGDFEKVTRTARDAEKLGTLPGGRHPLWVTEYWWLTKPPSPSGVTAKKQAQWIEESLYVFWKDGASVAIDYLLRDDPTYATGLFTSGGRKKPAYRAFSFPFVTDRRSRKRIIAWGKAPEGGKLRIELRKGGGWKPAKRLSVADGGVFKTGIRLRGPGRLRATIGDQRSLVWRQKR